MSSGNGSSIKSEKYQVIRELGRGGMGVVYLAEDRQLRRQVALKVLYDYLNRDRAFVERFQEEACSVSTLHHPNIVCVHGLERSGDTVAIDMEFVEGVALDHLSQVTPHVAAGIARDVLGGLAACHQIGVVHRDIKPSNILLNQTGQAKITDFGLATAYASQMENTMHGGSSSGFYMGTPRYMPIQAWEGGRPEPTWDLYAFGVVLHELISGNPAFKGDNPVAVMRRQLAESLPRLDTVNKKVSPEFARFVDSLLASSRKESSESTAVGALECLRNTPEYHELKDSDTATTVGIPSKIKKIRKVRDRSRRRLTWRVLTPIVLLAVLAAVAFFRMPLEWARPGAVGKPSTTIALSTVSPAPVQFFELTAINKDDFGAGTWMVENDENGQPRRITGFSPLELWSLTVDAQGEGGRLPFRGYWGACLSASNRTARHGTLTGYLLWEPEAGRITVYTDRSRAHDNVREEISLAGRMKDSPYDRAAFTRDLESNIALQGLLYRELLARPLPWAVELEGMLPALANGRVIVPYAEQAVTLDGNLEEPLWTEARFNSTGRIGEIAAQAATGEPRLIARWTRDALYLGARVGGCRPGTLLELGLLPALELSTTQSGRFFVSFGERGLESARYVVNTREQPWSCDWEGAMTLVDGEARVEIRIPLDSLVESARIEAGKRWRMNVRMTIRAADGSRSTLVEWGGAEHEALEHGALLVFER